MSQRAQQPGRTRYEPQTSLGPVIAVFVVAVLIAISGGTTWFALWAGAKLDGRRSSGGPIDAMGDLFIGMARFTGSAWTVLSLVRPVVARHPEAVSRLEAMWRAWEHLRLDPALGMSVWWRDHVDTLLAVLTHPDGTFKGCQEGDSCTPAQDRLQGRLAHQLRPH